MDARNVKENEAELGQGLKGDILSIPWSSLHCILARIITLIACHSFDKPYSFPRFSLITVKKLWYRAGTVSYLVTVTYI